MYWPSSNFLLKSHALSSRHRPSYGIWKSNEFRFGVYRSGEVLRAACGAKGIRWHFFGEKVKKNSSNALRNAYDLALRFRELESVNGPRGAYCNAPSSTKKMFTLLWRRVTLTVIIVLYYCFSILYTLPLYRAARIMSRLQTVSGGMPAGYDDVCRWRFPARFHCVALSAAPAHRRKQYYYYYSRRSSCVWRLNSPMERAERIVTT